MTVFVDTSAFFALLDSDDQYHQTAEDTWAALVRRREALFTTNYVLVEATALLGRRLGFPAVQDLHRQLVGVLQVHWVDLSLHERAVGALLTAGARHLSLVDCVSFEVMRRLGLDAAFTFDAHFPRQGFRCIP